MVADDGFRLQLTLNLPKHTQDSIMPRTSWTAFARYPKPEVAIKAGNIA